MPNPVTPKQTDPTERQLLGRASDRPLAQRTFQISETSAATRKASASPVPSSAHFYPRPPFCRSGPSIVRHEAARMLLPAPETPRHGSVTTKPRPGQDYFFCRGIDLLKRQNTAPAVVWRHYGFTDQLHAKAATRAQREPLHPPLQAEP